MEDSARFSKIDLKQRNIYRFEAGCQILLKFCIDNYYMQKSIISRNNSIL